MSAVTDHHLHRGSKMKLEIQENACGLARKLFADGLDPNETLEFYRGDVLCLRGKAGDFARVRVTTNAPGTPVVRVAEKDGSGLSGGFDRREVDADPWNGHFPVSGAQPLGCTGTAGL